jgi:hypothetical protein
MVGVIETHSKFAVRAVFTYLQAEGVNLQDSFAGLRVFTARSFPAKRKCLCPATNLKMAEER